MPAIYDAGTKAQAIRAGGLTLMPLRVPGPGAELICNATVTCMPGNIVPLERGLEEDTAPLWRALADPTRRRILDLLRERPLITGEIAAQFPISRIAVMRHLEVLSEAGLAVSRKRGRQRWHYLNTVPLQKLHRRWADPAAAGFASALLRLQDTVEAEGRHMEPIRPTIDIAQDIEIAGTPAAVFAALTKDIGGWWGHPFVTAWAPDEHLMLTGSFHMGVGVGVAAFDLTESGASTLVRFSFRAIGVVDAEAAGAMTRGWAELVGIRLKALAETGTRLGIDPDEPPSIRPIK